MKARASRFGWDIPILTQISHINFTFLSIYVKLTANYALIITANVTSSSCRLSGHQHKCHLCYNWILWDETTKKTVGDQLKIVGAQVWCNLCFVNKGWQQFWEGLLWMADAPTTEVILWMSRSYKFSVLCADWSAEEQCYLLLFYEPW